MGTESAIEFRSGWHLYFLDLSQSFGTIEDMWKIPSLWMDPAPYGSCSTMFSSRGCS